MDGYRQPLANAVCLEQLIIMLMQIQPIVWVGAKSVTCKL